MPQSLKHYLYTLRAFAISFVIVVLCASFAGAVSPARNRHEFPESWQTFVFLLIAGSFLLIVNLAGFGLGFLPVLWQRWVFPAPLLSGTLAGLASIGLAGTGIPTLIGVPRSIGPVAAGLFVGLCLTLLSLSAAVARRLVAVRA